LGTRSDRCISTDEVGHGDGVGERVVDLAGGVGRWRLARQKATRVGEPETLIDDPDGARGGA
jgi:hypothetical protein